ncbi:TetR/AcrR family transcriptional regulator [Natronoglycomyces albus]|uniref:TetR family transcriptional regulator n=1 Tax=Natronoglycomyces albus TaxID=2811108 RepID=A0A895XSK0_9ACTN|nr:TetR family transcriptional regulator [Natronoglycomyces albus]QSB05240.1 TetR family transcriptional regulator [Natronoglycomyces albus]
MRIAPSDDDLSSAARIRNAAIELFARDGFDTGLRAIANHADVSLGLIRHHYGSKDGLRSACDAHILSVVEGLMAAKFDSENPTATFIQQLASSAEYTTLTRYMVRDLQAGGQFARDFMERLIEHTQTYLERGVELGTLKPSIDPAGRARFLTNAAMGSMLIEFGLLSDQSTEATWQQYVDRVTLPALELYTQGLFTDRQMLDAYLSYVSDPPERDAEAQPDAELAPRPPTITRHPQKGPDYVHSHQHFQAHQDIRLRHRFERT